MNWQFHSAEELAQRSTGWDHLNERCGGSPLLTSRFLAAALRAFGSGREKLACLGDPADPQGMAVLVERRGGVWETFQPSQAPIGFWLIRPGLDLQNVLGSLIKALPGFPLMAGVSQQDPHLLARPDDTANLRTLDYIETARMVIAGDFDSYWEQRGKNLRQNMRKARNKLEKAGLELRLECITDPEKVEEAIEHYSRMESASWKAREGTAVGLDNAQGRFYVDLLENQCRDGAGRIYQLMFNDRIVAMDLCVHAGEVMVILKTTYDDAMSEYSPAMLMHQELFKSLYDAGSFKRIEFYGKVMDWHLRFTEDKRTMYHLNYYRWGWLKRLLSRNAVTGNPAADNASPVESARS